MYKPRLIKSLYSLALQFVYRCWDYRLREYTLPVKKKGSIVFKIFDYGRLCRFRASTFERKEPETLKWIDGFDPRDSLLDIGANIGVYSLYAAKRGVHVVALEPDCLNFALLIQNIRLNECSDLIRAYPFALNNNSGVFPLFVSEGEWGTAGNSCGEAINHEGKSFEAKYVQQTYGISCLDLIQLLDTPVNHLKVDVDGNEGLIIDAASALLTSPSLKSILIELSENRPDYDHCIRLIKSYGFILNNIEGANHIFKRYA